ncbi:TlpA disulfide reductase family protein [Chitinophaga sp.]|uniref:TlpA family protein disulfide reductase n=1 Tax=Chitinophaga sp. TaxID=1869181 RepID=UPI0031DB49A0
MPFVSFAQKKYELTINVNNTIEKEKLSFSIDADQRNISVQGEGNNQVKVTGELIDEAIPLTITYNQAASTFILTDHPAIISLHYNNNALEYDKPLNAFPVFDTVYNNYFKEIYHNRLPELTAYFEFWKGRDNSAYKNDSLFNIIANLHKALSLKALPTIREYPNQYYSFWFLYNQLYLCQYNMLARDTVYMRTLYNILQYELNPRFAKSKKGQSIAAQLEGLLNPPVLMHSAPTLSALDLTGNAVSLNKSNKYLLLNFWASWCGPCLAEIPFYQGLVKEFPKDKLEVIGINTDRSIVDCVKAVSEKSMNWQQVFDGDKKIVNGYGIIVLPTTILIDDKGIIIYRKEGVDTTNLHALLVNKLL